MSLGGLSGFRDSISIGGLQVTVQGKVVIIKKQALFSNASDLDFVSFDDFQAPQIFDFLVGLTYVESDKKDSIRFGFADDTDGLNFVELLPESIMTPAANTLQKIELVMNVPSNKFNW